MYTRFESFRGSSSHVYGSNPPRSFLLLASVTPVDSCLQRRDTTARVYEQNGLQISETKDLYTHFPKMNDREAMHVMGEEQMSWILFFREPWSEW